MAQKLQNGMDHYIAWNGMWPIKVQNGMGIFTWRVGLEQCITDVDLQQKRSQVILKLQQVTVIPESEREKEKLHTHGCIVNHQAHIQISHVL